jgi:hypothetical protein
VDSVQIAIVLGIIGMALLWIIMFSINRGEAC